MNLFEIGWASYASEEAPKSSYARVALATRERFLVWTERGEVEATISGRLRHLNQSYPCVGDWVVLRQGDVIAEILPRRTKLSRKEPGNPMREQILAANLDVLFIVSGLDRDYNPRRLERYLVLARESGARPVILLNKADLRADVDEIVNGTQSYAPGISVLPLSALEGWGLGSIAKQVQPGQTAALIGSSGAGKTTILNRLLGDERRATTAVRASDSKGRHTTVVRELVLMPEKWLLMDLPGLRELQIWADPEQVDNTFSEILELAQFCKFRDCTHQTEPGCAVRNAGFDEARLGSYQKLKSELAFLEKKTDIHAAHAYKNRCKAVEKEMRRHPKRLF